MWRVKFRWLRIFSGGESSGRINQSFSCLVQITEYLSPKWLLPAFKTRSVPSGEGQFPKLARCLMGFHSNLNSSVICMTSVLSFTRWCQWLKLSSERLRTPGWAPGKHSHSWRCTQDSSVPPLACIAPFLGHIPCLDSIPVKNIETTQPDYRNTSAIFHQWQTSKKSDFSWAELF